MQTIGQLERELSVPHWKIRRVVDELAPDLPRAGLYRLIPADVVSQIRDRLKEQGWIEEDSTHEE